MCPSGGIGCDGEDRGQSRRCLSSVEIYNPDTDTWRVGPTLPTSLLSLRTNASNIGVVGGKLYLCGYYKGAGQSYFFDVFCIKCVRFSGNSAVEEVFAYLFTQ